MASPLQLAENIHQDYHTSIFIERDRFDEKLERDLLPTHLGEKQLSHFLVW